MSGIDRGVDPTAPDEKLVRFWLEDAKERPPNVEAWAAMVAKLRVAAYREEHGLADARLPSGMTSVVTTLVAVYQFLEQHDFIKQERLHIPASRLMSALHDLGQGKRSPLLTPVRAGDTRKSTVQANVSAIAARALSEMVENGEPLKASSLKVARAVREGKLAGYSKCNAAKVQNWRARLEEGEGAVTDEALARYRAPLPPEAGETHAAHIAWLMKALRTSPALRYG